MSRSSSRTGTRDLVGVIDIGTSKVCAVIADCAADGALTLRGIGHQRSAGIKSGMVIDADDAERSVRAAVGKAERMAGVSADRISVAISAGRMRSTDFVARAPLEDGIVRHGDISRLLAGGEAYLDRAGRTVIQLTRSDWCLDDAAGIADPVGLAGRELSVHLNAVTADDGPVRNILAIVEKGYMLAERLIAAPYASALSVTTPEERRLGVLVVEMGAGVTSLATFADGRLVHVDTVPVGGNHVTFDIARGLVTTVPEAERIKTLYGTLIKASSDASEVIAYPVAGEEEHGGLHQTSKAHVRDIVAPRIEGLFDLVVERLGAAGLEPFVAGRVVLTGGASQLLGLDQVWSARFGGNPRIGRPEPIGRMPASMCSPAFATVIGLLHVVTGPQLLGAAFGSDAGSEGYMHRLERWIRESF